jgi:hypothetical protein
LVCNHVDYFESFVTRLLGWPAPSIVAAIKRPLLFTADIWIFWIALTLPIGVAIEAHAANPVRSVSAKATVYSGMTLWLVMTAGMATWSWQNSLSIRIIALDSIVNLVPMMVPALFARLTLVRSIITGQFFESHP